MLSPPLGPSLPDAAFAAAPLSPGPAAAAPPPPREPAAAAAEDFDVEVFHDGACPLCAKEIRMLQRLDTRRRIRFVDIAAADFDPAAIGVSWDELMARLHGRLPDGSWIQGVEVFRRLYAAVGFRRLVAVSRLPGLSHLLALAYRIFAANRLRFTGRCDAAGCRLPATPTGQPARPSSPT
jgi:predicted DCC family thiol-disulfide oxidoreductase YuxK